MVVKPKYKREINDTNDRYICEFFFYWLRRSKQNHNFTTEQRKSNTEKKKSAIKINYTWFMYGVRYFIWSSWRLLTIIFLFVVAVIVVDFYHEPNVCTMNIAHWKTREGDWFLYLYCKQISTQSRALKKRSWRHIRK